MKLIPEQNKFLSCPLNVNIDVGTHAAEPMGIRKGKLCEKHSFCLLPQPGALVGARDRTMCYRYNGADPVCSGHGLESTFKLLSSAQAGTGDC